MQSGVQGSLLTTTLVAMRLQWSYELLVFMVLLNFLLAIIVDAFSEVRHWTSSHEQLGNAL
jgi:hypothetical protein